MQKMEIKMKKTEIFHMSKIVNLSSATERKEKLNELYEIWKN